MSCIKNSEYVINTDFHLQCSVYGTYVALNTNCVFMDACMYVQRFEISLLSRLNACNIVMTVYLGVVVCLVIMKAIKLPCLLDY